MQNLRCREEANIQAHLDTIMKMQEQLAGMGAMLSANNLVTTILASLPSSYGMLLSTVTVTARLMRVLLTPNFITMHILEEYDCRVVDAHKTGSTRGNSAMATGSHSQG